jgi:hypothetical protein
MTGQRYTDFSHPHVCERHRQFVACAFRHVRSPVLNRIITVTQRLGSGASGIYGPYQDVRLYRYSVKPLS